MTNIPNSLAPKQTTMTGTAPLNENTWAIIQILMESAVRDNLIRIRQCQTIATKDFPKPLIRVSLQVNVFGNWLTLIWADMEIHHDSAH